VSYCPTVPLPISGSKFDKLGVRLRDAEQFSATDSEMLEQVLAAYDDALTDVRDRLRAMGLEPTTRLKTTQTLVDKLRRTAGLTIRGIHDIAGARIVLAGGRFQQDQDVSRIVEAFQGSEKAPRILDRRQEPSFGYRAVHVVLFVDRLPVEVQIRTDLQHRWAEVVENLGDRWGRGLRYGEGIGEPDKIAVASGARSITRAGFLAQVQSLGGQLDQLEQLSLRIARLRASRGGDPEITSLEQDVGTLEDALRDNLKLLLGQCDEMG
jgi:ppGpp synthetase/RelA/SpoT-type nucleotidyltranferase